MVMADLADRTRQLTVFPSALGWMAAQWDDGLLSRLTFGHTAARAALAAPGLAGGDPTDLPADLSSLVTRLQAYAEGAEDDFLDVRVDLSGRTAFQRRVLDQCRRIARGRTVTYGQLAAQAGSPHAARAVGNVMANNRVPLIIPCHRVVGSNAGLGGFSAPDGLRMKKRLLRLEGAWA